MRRLSTLKLLVFNLLFVSIAFSGFIFCKHYSSDDFFCLYNQQGEAYAVTYYSYRVVLGIIYYVLNLLDINVVKYQVVMGVCMLLCFSGAVTLTTMQISELLGGAKNDKKLIYAVNAGSLLMIVNVFASEWMWFALAYLQWGLAVLFSVIAAIFVIKPEKKFYALSIFCLVVVAGCYQNVLSIYVFLIMTFIYVLEDGCITKRSILKIIQAAIASVIAIVANVLITKILIKCGFGTSASRMQIEPNECLGKLVSVLKDEVCIFKNGKGLLPEYILIAFFFIYVGALIVYCVKYQKKRKLLFIVVILFAGNLVRWLPQFMQQDVYQPARMLVPFMGNFFVLHFLMLHSEKSKKLYMVAGMSLVLLGINFVEVQTNAIDCIKTTAIQENELFAIKSYIENYEKENNIQVDKVAVVTDDNPTYKYYPEILNKNYYGEMATRSLLVSWSDLEILEFYTGKQFEKIEKERYEIQDYFDNKDFSYFSPDSQIKILDNGTAIICVY